MNEIKTKKTIEEENKEPIHNQATHTDTTAVILESSPS